MTLPPHIRRHLQATGVLTDRGTSRRARLIECRFCRAWVVAGLDADVAAFDSSADPTPLTPTGEVLALLDGRATFDLTERRDRSELDYRDAAVITGHPADRGRVLAEHRCGLPVPTTWAAPPQQATRTATDPDTPPF